jgi:cytochrome b561
MSSATAGYRWPAKLLHWITAVAVIAAVVFGFAMTSAQPGPAQNQLYDLHRSFGALILLLTGLRLLWRLYAPPPPPVAGMAKWQVRASQAAHGLLYVSLFAMPLLGWAGTSAFPARIMVFGLFELPPILEPNRELSETLLEIHEVAGRLMCGLIAVHFAPALHHHFVKKDDALRRMLP